MKKVLATGMALAMLVGAMTVNASAGYSADSPNHITGDTANNTGKYGVVSSDYSAGNTIGESEVTVKFNNGVSGSITNVYAVSFTPSELTFTYGGGAQYIWNPENQKYEALTPGGDTWSSTSNVITITNYSDLPVDIEAKFTKDQGVTQAVTASFTDTDDDNKTDGILSLESAVTTNNLGETGNPTSGTFTVAFNGSLDGALYLDGSTLGKITLTLKVPQA